MATCLVAAGLRREGGRVSYLIGAPEGVDIGWEGEQRFEKGEKFGDPRPPLNDHQSMASTAKEMVRWYQQALAGAFFKKPQTLVEFSRSKRWRMPL